MDQQESAGTAWPDRVRCVPVPDWVAHEPYSSPMSQLPDAGIDDGICRLLHDVQVDLSGAEYARHHRSVQRVLTRAGAENAAQFAIEFDPAFERLDVHFIRIVRGDERIEYARPGVFQIFRRESDLNRLILNGRLTTSLVIPDVRVDDVIEIALTFYGSNPALGGRYAAWAVFDPFEPWLDDRHRLLRPVTREIFVRPFNGPPERSVAVANGVEESQWRMVGQKRRSAEALTPPWLIVAPALQYSEFASWNDVARLFAPFYDSPEMPASLAAEIDQLAAAHANPADRAVEWLRFVQQRLRYFALNLGEGGLIPRELASIWSSRFGDCKDATRLYVAGARRMGLEACAALVSTTLGRSLDALLPSPAVFNHCIARLRLNGKSYWLDPTMQWQCGDLATIFQAHSGWGLPLTPDTAGLEKFDDETPLCYLNLDEELHLGPKPESPAKLKRYIEYYHWAADTMRNHIANEGTAKYAQERLKEVQQAWPNIRETDPIVIRDDPKANSTTAILSYEMNACWTAADTPGLLCFKILDATFGGALAPLQGGRRETDIYLARPRKMTRTVRMFMPCRWAGDGWHYLYEASGIRYRDRLAIEGKTIVHSKELTVDTWSLPAARAAEYGRVTDALAKNGTSIHARERFGRLRPAVRGGSFMVIFFFVWIAVLLLGAIARVATAPR